MKTKILLLLALLTAGLAARADTTNLLNISSVELVSAGTNVQIVVTCPAARLAAFQALSGGTNSPQAFVSALVESAARAEVQKAVFRARSTAAAAAEKQITAAIK